MGNRYKVGKYKLTVITKCYFNYLKEKKGLKSIEQIVQGLYKDCISGKMPDIWTHETKTEKCNKVVQTLVLKVN